MSEVSFKDEHVIGRHVCLDDLIALPQSPGWHRVANVSLHIDPIEVLLQTEEGDRVVGTHHRVYVRRPHLRDPDRSR